MSVIDISMPLGPKTAPYPGDQPLSRVWTLQMRSGDVCNLSTLTLSSHLGTHVDAPFHYDDGGRTIEHLDLDLFIGPAWVTEVHVEHSLVMPADLPVDELQGVSRLLIKTGTYPDPERFAPGFAGLAPETVDVLAQIGVRLIGIDTPSVDPLDGDLAAHDRFCQHGMLILENLRLAHVAPGAYELIALPLRLVGGDGSPVRAVLRR